MCLCLCLFRSVHQCVVVSSGEFVGELYRGESSAYWNISSAGVLSTTTAERILTQHQTGDSARHNISLSGTHTRSLVIFSSIYASQYCVDKLHVMFLTCRWLWIKVTYTVETSDSCMIPRGISDISSTLQKSQNRTNTVV